jgi:hypothetical protein
MESSGCKKVKRWPKSWRRAVIPAKHAV